MTDLPISFSNAMVLALLDGSKTQTRRLHPPVPRFQPQGCLPLALLKRLCWWDYWSSESAEVHRFKLPYAVGDRLWVREAWRAHTEYNRLAPRDIPKGADVQYVADDPVSPWLSRYRHARFMPRWASRITLTVTEVRVQRLWLITNNDAIAEGIKPQYQRAAREGGAVLGWGYDGLSGYGPGTPKAAFALLWNSLHGTEAWEANPWVAAYTFEVALDNIDKIRAAA